MNINILKIKKRNGNIVDFNIEKIAIAVNKAFFAVRGVVDNDKTQIIIENVAAKLEKYPSNKLPTVEEVQDLVEVALMQEQLFDIARDYMIYRYEHAKIREEKKQITLKKIEEEQLLVTKRNGQKETFSFDKLRRTLSRVTKGYENVIDIEAIIHQCRSELYEDIKTEDIAQTLVMVTRSMIEQDPAYSNIASRLLNNIIYKEVIGSKLSVTNLNEDIRLSFINNIQLGIELNKMDKRLRDFDLIKLSKNLAPERDDLFLYLGCQTLYDRYIIRNPKNSKPIETLQAFWMRVAMGLAINEENKNEKAISFYNLISTLRFVPSTPTLFHSGTCHPQLSSCYLNTVEDSLDHIFKTCGDNAQLAKWAGGIGTDWTKVRATGAYIKGTNVESQGIIPFLKVANSVTAAINRSGGKRRGATCVYLETWHHDIESFLELKKNTGDERLRTHDIDTANWIPDLFMKRVRENSIWTLFSPEEVPDLHETYGKSFEDKYQKYEALALNGKIKMYKQIPAMDLWKKMITMLFETGHPWITFKDPANIRSPQDHVGVIHNSNLCTEITLNTSAQETAVCNLGSINLTKHLNLADKTIDQELLKETITIAMRMLDNVIDINFYPTPEAKESNTRHRPVGLGIMGLQNVLYATDINFSSIEAIEFTDTNMEFISYHAILASTALAKERGAYPSFTGSKWDRKILPLDTIDLLEQERGEKIDIDRKSTLDWNRVKEAIDKYGMRNSNCLAIAPTATISNISGAIPSIEPIYKNIYVKSNQGGEYVIINSYLVDDLKKIGLWSQEMVNKIKYNDGSIQNIDNIPENLKNKYKEAFEIDVYLLLKMAAHRSKWIDQSQSLNIFFKGQSGKELSNIYMFAWKLGLKTTYYLRTLAASQVEKSTLGTEQFGVTHTRQQPIAVMQSTSAGLNTQAQINPTNLNLAEKNACDACQ